jgi:hypothetical protein
MSPRSLAVYVPAGTGTTHARCTVARALVAAPVKLATAVWVLPTLHFPRHCTVLAAPTLKSKLPSTTHTALAWVVVKATEQPAMSVSVVVMVCTLPVPSAASTCTPAMLPRVACNRGPRNFTMAYPTTTARYAPAAGAEANVTVTVLASVVTQSTSTAAPVATSITCTSGLVVPRLCATA